MASSMAVKRMRVTASVSHLTHTGIHLLQLSKAASLRRLQRSLSAYFSILSEASTETTSKPSSSNIIESTLQNRNMFRIVARGVSSFLFVLPRATCHVQDTLASLLAQQIDQKVLVVVCARVLVSNENLPHLGSLAIGVLIAHSFGGDTVRPGNEHTVCGGGHNYWLSLGSRSHLNNFSMCIHLPR